MSLLVHLLYSRSVGLLQSYSVYMPELLLVPCDVCPHGYRVLFLLLARLRCIARRRADTELLERLT